MAQEVYVVMFTIGGSGVADGIDWYVNTELREVFTSLEKAKKYCETPDNYLDDFAKWFSSKFKPFWDARGRTYVLLDDAENEIFFSIETRNVQ